MELTDLRLIAQGYDVTLVEAYGSELIMNEGANMQAFSVKHSALAKSAKDHMKAAKAAKKSNNMDKAKKEYNAAIKDLKDLQKECEKIEDDHLVVIFVETFIKAFVPTFLGAVMATATGGISTLVGATFGYILGLSKTLNYSAAIQKNLTQPNKAGAGGKYDSAQWWKTGATRGDAMTYFDRMITACEKAKEQL